jgi:DNA-binding NarL/FixJ family response regulator
VDRAGSAVVPDGRVLRVLLVEDNPGDRLLLAAVLEGVGASVVLHHVDCLADAETSLEGALPDVLLLDLSLPDAVGMEGIHRLRRVQPSVPIVVLTGLDDRELADRALAAGAQDYLVKGPAVTGPQLERTLRYAVQRHQLLAEREAHQAVVERSEANFRAVAAGADGVLIADLEGRVQYANPAALALFGANESEFVGHNLPFPLEPGDRREVEIGDKRTAEIVVAATQWAGAPAVLASLRDVTAQRELQQRLRNADAMQLVGRLAAGVAHDFNNQLMGIQGHLDLARLTIPEDHPATRHLVAIDETTEVATRLVSRLLASGRGPAECRSR